MQNVKAILLVSIIIHGSIWSAAGSDKTTLSLAWGASSRIGQRPTMEDCYSVEGTAFGIFDGHRGDFAAKYAAKHLLPRLQMAQEGMSDYHRIFQEIDQEIEAQDTSGTTATTAIIKQGSIGYMLYIARVGDSYSMCVGGQNSGYKVHYGEVHRPESVTEQKRIRHAGGSVYLDRAEYVARVACPDASILGLGVTRALGDRAWPNAIISPEPFAFGHSLNPKTHKFLVLASDGVWDYVDSDLAQYIVQQTLQDDTEVPDLADEQDCEPSKESGNDGRAIAAARALRDAAYAHGSTDNITAMVINFVWN